MSALQHDLKYRLQSILYGVFATIALLLAVTRVAPNTALRYQ